MVVSSLAFICSFWGVQGSCVIKVLVRTYKVNGVCRCELSNGRCSCAMCPRMHHACSRQIPECPWAFFPALLQHWYLLARFCIGHNNMPNPQPDLSMEPGSIFSCQGPANSTTRRTRKAGRWRKVWNPDLCCLPRLSWILGFWCCWLRWWCWQSCRFKTFPNNLLKNTPRHCLSLLHLREWSLGAFLTAEGGV